MPYYYTPSEGVTQRLQQAEGALEFLQVDTVRVNGVMTRQFEVRRYNPSAGWEFVGRSQVSGKRDILRRAVADFEFGDESQYRLIA